jgi:hypothetical protein
MEIKSYTNGNKFYYVESEVGYICAFDKKFNNVWVVLDLESDEIEDIQDNVNIEQYLPV